jgi:hypothetical protein
MKYPKNVIPSEARNLLLNQQKADSSAVGLGMTGNFSMAV